MMSKKKTGERIDYHHCVWTRSHWNFGYAKLIRDHPCAGAYIPQKALHRKIHEFIGDVACPSDTACKKAYVKLEAKYKDGSVTKESPIDKKLEVLIKCFKFEKQTKRDLERQLKIVREYYQKGGQ